FDLFLKMAGHIMQWGLVVLAHLAELPLAVWEQHAPIAWTVPAAVLGIGWLLAPAGVPARWLGLISLLPLLLLQPARPHAGEAWLDVLDVGQGQAVLIRTHAHALLYDTGPAYHGEAGAGARIVVPNLRAFGVRRLDGLILSHDDNDHTGGAAAVLDAYPQSWVLSSAPPHSQASIPWPRGGRCVQGQRWMWDGVGFEILHPERADYNRSAVRDNDLSCVLRVRSTHYTVLLSGDIERASEMALLRRVPAQLRADVLLAPHHGSATSSTLEFLQQVQPRIAIFTVGYRNRFGHPAAAVRERYARLGIVQRRSDIDGALALRLGSELSLSAWRETHPRYWQGR
ncbi:MAG: DNA internalization-related competence protein ComEC/Rec2, partial [Burkholderiales bacterium]|nr:DNA internalization-related competence protein ComEC/Rec2 [Burkholderiales bacterium]